MAILFGFDQALFMAE